MTIMLSYKCNNICIRGTISKETNYLFLNITFYTKPITKNQVFAKPSKPFSIFSQTHLSTEKSFSLSASTAIFKESISVQPEIEKVKVVVKPMQKPRIVLKFIWMEKNIGLALDQVIPGHGSIPLSPYYIWPRKDAWEELKVLLETKPWISQKQMIILLNQATDIINLWQQSGGDLSPSS